MIKLWRTQANKLCESILNPWYNHDITALGETAKDQLCGKHSDDMMSPTMTILCMCPANERWRYIVTPSLIGWPNTQNGPRTWWSYFHETATQTRPVALSAQNSAIRSVVCQCIVVRDILLRSAVLYFDQTVLSALSSAFISSFWSTLDQQITHHWL